MTKLSLMTSHMSFMTGILIINLIIYLKVSIHAKKYANFQKIFSLFNKKGNKVLKNVKTHWISMLSPTNYIYYEYKLFIVKMHTKSAKSDATTKNLVFYAMWNSFYGSHVSIVWQCAYINQLIGKTMEFFMLGLTQAL
jgi:hypothetical protein